MIKQYKIDSVADLKQRISRYDNYIFTNYQGLTVEEIQGIKNKLRALKIEYKVVKNTFFRIAMKESGKLDMDKTVYEYPLAIAMAPKTADISQAIKIMYDFIKEKNKLVIKDSIIDDRIFDPKQLEEISKLPSRNVLIGKIVGLMKAPISRLHRVLHGMPQKLILTLKEIEKTKA